MKTNKLLKLIITFLVMILCMGNLSVFAAGTCKLQTVLPTYSEITDSVSVYVYKVATLSVNGTGYVKEAGFSEVDVDLDGATASKLSEYCNRYAEVANAAAPVRKLRIGEVLEAEWFTDGIYLIMVDDRKADTPTLRHIDGARGKETAVTAIETETATYTFLPEIITVSGRDAFYGDWTGKNAIEIKCEKTDKPSKDDGDNGSNVTTGDNFRVRLFWWIAGVSAGIFLLFLVIRKKNAKETEAR